MYAMYTQTQDYKFCFLDVLLLAVRLLSVLDQAIFGRSVWSRKSLILYLEPFIIFSKSRVPSPCGVCYTWGDSAHAPSNWT